MEYVIITSLSLIFMIYISVFFIQSYKSKKIKDQTLSLCQKYGTVSTHKSKYYFDFHGKTYELLFFYVPTQGELTINSRTIWEVRTSSKSNLIDQSIFLSSDKPKIIVIHPSTSAIKRYINENELVFVSFNDFFYNMYVTRHHELENLLKAEIL